MRLALAAAMIATSAAAQSEAVHFSPHPYAHASVAADRGDYQCRKDHAGLTLASAEPEPAGDARLAAAVAAGGSVIVADIEAIACAYCAAAIERAFLRRDDVAAAFLNARARTLTIVAKSELADKTVRQLIERRGYSVTAIDRPEDGEILSLQ